MVYVKIPDEFEKRINKLSKQHGIEKREEYRRAIILYLSIFDSNEKSKVKQLTVERENGILENIVNELSWITYC